MVTWRRIYTALVLSMALQLWYETWNTATLWHDLWYFHQQYSLFWPYMRLPVNFILKTRIQRAAMTYFTWVEITSQAKDVDVTLMALFQRCVKVVGSWVRIYFAIQWNDDPAFQVGNWWITNAVRLLLLSPTNKYF